MIKKIYLIILLIASSYIAKAQVFWTEDFGTGCNQGQLASAFTGANGAWSIASTGTNDATANTFYVGAQEAGNSVGACGTGCIGTVDASLHVGNIAVALASLAADGGASYFSGVAGACAALGICATTNKRAQSPLINCSGRSTITISFNYIENGDLAIDDASIWYSVDGGTTWLLLNNMAKTALTCAPQGTWTAYSFSLPATANNNANVKIGFNWTNNDDGAGTDPSFAVDDIVLTAAVSTGISNVAPISLEVFSNGGIITINSSDAVKLLGVFDVLGRNITTSLENNMINLEAQPSGVYFVRIESKGQVYTKKVFIKQI
ncbi:MAG: T9SS type A sorting domain-containing protein [Bacteroidetes bacterium]|nr:T9SS type A sorting domain-containing protein [Bacteroidota bacterium]